MLGRAWGMGAEYTPVDGSLLACGPGVEAGTTPANPLERRQKACQKTGLRKYRTDRN